MGHMMGGKCINYSYFWRDCLMWSRTKSIKCLWAHESYLDDLKWRKPLWYFMKVIWDSLLLLRDPKSFQFKEGIALESTAGSWEAGSYISFPVLFYLTRVVPQIQYCDAFWVIDSPICQRRKMQSSEFIEDAIAETSQWIYDYEDWTNAATSIYKDFIIGPEPHLLNVQYEPHYCSKYKLKYCSL